MIGLIQRVTHAQVSVDKKVIAKIDTGILLFLGVEKTDNHRNCERLLEKVINFRIFEEKHHSVDMKSTGNEKMHLSLLDISGELLIVPQFTLAANTKKGTKPSFGSAAPPKIANDLFEKFIRLSNKKIHIVERGEFGADMAVSLVNDGPVTFWLQK